MSTVTDEVAHALYSSGCLKFGTFKIKSGAISPYYIDLARLLSSPKDLCTIAEIAAKKIKEMNGYDQLNKVASIELKGALIIPSISCKVNLPCIVVRKEEKAYGVTGRTAGADVSNGDNILFFDDVISEGISKIEGIRPLQELGGNVKYILVVIDREQGGKEKLEKLGYEIYSLAKVSELADSLFSHKHISEQQHDEVLAFVKTFNPNV